MIPDAYALPPGTLLNQTYAIEQLLGSEGEVITYRARDRRLDRHVAIQEFFRPDCKRLGLTVLPAAAPVFDAGRDRFLEEARILARVVHPHLRRIYTSFEENGTAYLALEELEGETLRAILERGDPFSVGKALDVVECIGKALAVLHSAGQHHPDLAPETVVITPAGRVALMGPRHPAKPGRAPSPYAPPDVAAPGPNRAQAAEIYSLGAVAYHLLAGVPPPDAAARAARANLPPIHERNPEVPRWIGEAIEWALSMDPADRPQQVEELLEFIHCEWASARTSPPVLSNPRKAPIPADGEFRPRDRPEYLVSPLPIEIAWPALCVCCGAPAECGCDLPAPSRLRSPIPSGVVPYCLHCLQHVELYEEAQRAARSVRCRYLLGNAILGIGFALLALGALLDPIKTHAAATAAMVCWLAGVASCIIGFFQVILTQAKNLGNGDPAALSMEKMSLDCTGPGPSVRYLGLQEGYPALAVASLRCAEKLRELNTPDALSHVQHP